MDSHRIPTGPASLATHQEEAEGTTRPEVAGRSEVSDLSTMKPLARGFTVSAYPLPEIVRFLTPLLTVPNGGQKYRVVII
jgi:head-tail adaptor